MASPELKKSVMLLVSHFAKVGGLWFKYSGAFFLQRQFFMTLLAEVAAHRIEDMQNQYCKYECRIQSEIPVH